MTIGRAIIRVPTTRELESPAYFYRDPKTGEMILIDPPPRGGNSYRPSNDRDGGRGDSPNRRESQRSGSCIDPKTGERVDFSRERGGRERDEVELDRHGKPKNPVRKESLPYRGYGC